MEVDSRYGAHLALQRRGVRHEVRTLEPPVTSDERLPEALGLDRADCVVTRVFRVEGARRPDGAVVHVAAVLTRPGDRLDVDAVRQALDAERVRAASADDVRAHTGQDLGLVCPLVLPEDVAVLADTALAGKQPDLGSSRATAGARAVRWCVDAAGAAAVGVGLRDLLVETDARVATLTPPSPRIPEARLISLSEAVEVREAGRRGVREGSRRTG